MKRKVKNLSLNNQFCLNEEQLDQLWSQLPSDFLNTNKKSQKETLFTFVQFPTYFNADYNEYIFKYIKKFIGFGGYYIEQKDISNKPQDQDTYFPFLLDPFNGPGPSTTIISTFKLSDKDLSLMGITQEDLQSIAIVFNSYNHICIMNRDLLDRGDKFYFSSTTELCSPYKDHYDYKDLILSKEEKSIVYVPTPSNLSLHQLKEQCFDLSKNIFDTIENSEAIEVTSQNLSAISIRKILNPFLGYLMNKPLGHLNQEEVAFVKQVIKPEYVDWMTQFPAHSISIMELIYDQSLFTEKFVQMLRQRKELPFFNPKLTIGGFTKLVPFIQNNRWTVDTQTQKFTLDNSSGELFSDQ